MWNFNPNNIGFFDREFRESRESVFLNSCNSRDLRSNPFEIRGSYLCRAATLGSLVLSVAVSSFAGTHSASTTCYVDTTKASTTLSLVRFSDTGGTPKSVFNDGETLRVTVSALQSGWSAFFVVPSLRIDGPGMQDFMTPLYNSGIGSPLPLSSGVPMSKSWDWPIPLGTAPGNYYIESTVRLYSDPDLVVAMLTNEFFEIQTADSDSDGLPDWWELGYYGHVTDNVTSNDIVANAINTALDAYVADFDPTNSLAGFLISDLSPLASGNILQWDEVAGRVYTVYWTSNLLDDFSTLQTNYSGGVFTDTVHSAEPEGFYHLEVELE